MQRAAKEGANPPLLGGTNLAQPQCKAKHSQLAPPSPVPLQQPQLQAQSQLQVQPQQQTEARCCSSEADGADDAASTVKLSLQTCSGSSPLASEVADTQINQPATPPACFAAQSSRETASALDGVGSQKVSEPPPQETRSQEVCLMHVSPPLQSEGSVLNRKERQPLRGSTAKGSSLRKRHVGGSGLQEPVRRSQRVKMRISS